MLQEIKAWLAEDRQIKLANKQRATFKNISRSVQLMEYDNELWIALDGVPVIMTKDLKSDMFTVLTKARNIRYNYLYGSND